MKLYELVFEAIKEKRFGDAYRLVKCQCSGAIEEAEKGSTPTTCGLEGCLLRCGRPLAESEVDGEGPFCELNSAISNVGMNQDRPELIKKHPDLCPDIDKVKDTLRMLLEFEGVDAPTMLRERLSSGYTHTENYGNSDETFPKRYGCG